MIQRLFNKLSIILSNFKMKSNQDTLITAPSLASSTHPSHLQDSKALGQYQFLEETALQFGDYEKEIALLESSLMTTQSIPEDIDINQQHFWVKRSTNNGETLIQIKSQYLQDSVFSNIESIHQQKMEDIFVTAKSQIDRLTAILIDRDRQIVNLNEQITNILKDSKAKTQDSDLRKKQYEMLVQENKDLDKRVKELMGELSNKATRTSQFERNSSSNIVKIGSRDRMSIGNLNESVHSITSSKLKQMVSSGIQTHDTNYHNPISIPSAANSYNPLISKLQTDLLNKLRQIQSLNSTVSTFGQQLQSLKNDNYLLSEDLQKQRNRTAELGKIINVQNQHIDNLRSEIKNSETLRKQSIDRVRQQSKQDPRKVINGVHPHTLSPSQIPQFSVDSKALGELKSQNSRLRIQIANLQNSTKSLNTKIQLLTTQNNKLTAELSASKSQQTQLNNQIVTSKSQYIALSNQLSRVKAQNQLLVSEKGQLQSQMKTIVTHQPNIDILKKNNEQLLGTIKSLESRILQLSKVQQQGKQLKEQIKTLKEKSAVKDRELQNQKIKLDQQLTNNQQLIQINNDKQKRFNNTIDFNKDNELLLERVQVMRNQIMLKNSMIGGLEKKIKEQDKIIQIYKNQFNSKNKGGIVGFGTSNSLSERSPQKPLQIETPEELILVAKELLNKGPKQDNQDIYNVLGLITEQFEILRNQYYNNPGDMGLFVNGQPYSSNHSSEHQNSKSVYQNQINSYIASLLNKISDHESQMDIYEEEINRLKYQLDNSQGGHANHYNDTQEERTWEQLLHELDFEKKLTEKLSDYVKSLKQEISNLKEDLEDKNQEIFDLSTKIYSKRNEIREIDLHLGDVQNEYQRLLGNKVSSKRNIHQQPESEYVRNLLDEIQSYRLELEKAINLNQQLKQCLNNQSVSCINCQEYQFLVQELEGKLQNYEKLMMGELKRIFTSCEKEINRKERANIHGRIENLKEKTNIRSSREKQFQHSKQDSRIKVSKKKYNPRSSEYGSQTLDLFIQNQPLSLQQILVLMGKILQQVDTQKFHQDGEPILLENIVVTKFDETNPQTLVIQISPNRAGNRHKARTYLAPELLKGGEPTRKSLVWNLGLIFHYIVNKKPFFTRQSQIMDNNLSYRYENKVFPDLRSIIEGMLEKDAGRRRIFSQLRNIINNELSRARMMKPRG